MSYTELAEDYLGSREGLSRSDLYIKTKQWVGKQELNELITFIVMFIISGIGLYLHVGGYLAVICAVIFGWCLCIISVSLLGLILIPFAIFWNAIILKREWFDF